MLLRPWLVCVHTTEPMRHTFCEVLQLGNAGSGGWERAGSGCRARDGRREEAEQEEADDGDKGEWWSVCARGHGHAEGYCAWDGKEDVGNEKEAWRDRWMGSKQASKQKEVHPIGYITQHLPRKHPEPTQSRPADGRPNSFSQTAIDVFSINGNDLPYTNIVCSQKAR